MSANDSIIKALRDGGPIGSAFLSAFGAKSDEQKKAEADQAAALKNAQDQLGFDKDVYSNNQATVDHALGQIFGNDGPSAWDPQGPPPADSDTGFGIQPFTDANQPTKYGDDNYFGGGTNSTDIAGGNAGGVDNPGDPHLSGAQSAQNGSGTPAQNGNGWSLPGEYNKAADIQAQVFNQLRGTLNGIQDPQLAAKVADLQSEANISPEAKAARSDALNQLKGYTDVKETAQEKLMREMARREMEGQMKGQRDAMAANLKSRGVYGSGAEVASQLQTQQEAASRRALEELSAQANAQNRAMQALGAYGTLGIQSGNQDIAQGQAHDAVNEFNSTITEQHNQADAKQKAANNAAATGRATTLADAGNNLATGTERRAGNLTNTILAGAGLKTGTATQGANLVNGAASNLRASLGQDAAIQQAKDDTGTGYSPISL